jgi:nitrilase
MKLVAAIQMASGPNVGANLIEAARLISLCVDAGAGLVVLPENFAQMGFSEQDKLKIKETPGQGQIQDFLAEQSKKHGVWIVGGTVPLAAQDENKIRAACLLYNDKGECVARYDKIHLFDVDILATQESYVESETIEPGDEVVVVDTPFGKLGLAVCYDLRFPEMFRRMLDQDVEIFAVPAAFTAITGKAHWETIVRARAIENLCYVIAAAQGGYHISGRETHGDSMVVDPWGNIIDRLPRGSGYVIAKIDKERLEKTRAHFPALSHRRMHLL